MKKSLFFRAVLSSGVLGLVLFHNACGTSNSFTKLYGTTVGNPFQSLASVKILKTVCAVLTNCNSTLITQDCEDGVLKTSGIAEALGSQAGKYPLFQDLVNAENVGNIQPTNPSVSNCIATTSSLSCSQPEVTGAYQPQNALPFAGVPAMLSQNLGSCATVYAPIKKRIFVTSATMAGGFGGLRNADLACANAAITGGLGWNHWDAWISTSSIDAPSHITGTGPWYLVDNSTLVFNNLSTVSSGPFSAINMNEFGQRPANKNVWTGTLQTGLKSTNTCADWSLNNSTGVLGSSTSTGGAWTNAATLSCSTAAGLYCVESDNRDWFFIDPVGDSRFSFSAYPGQLQMSVPSGTTHDCWTGLSTCTRMMQNYVNPNSNVTFETKTENVTNLGSVFEGYGILLYQDPANMLRFEFNYNGGGPFASIYVVAGGIASAPVSSPTLVMGSSNYLRVVKAGSNYSLYFNVDGTWQLAGSVTQAMTINQVGLMVDNSKQQPAVTATFDYFTVK